MSRGGEVDSSLLSWWCRIGWQHILVVQCGGKGNTTVLILYQAFSWTANHSDERRPTHLGFRVVVSHSHFLGLFTYLAPRLQVFFPTQPRLPVFGIQDAHLCYYSYNIFPNFIYVSLELCGKSAICYLPINEEDRHVKTVLARGRRGQQL